MSDEEQIILPERYIRLEYLEDTGTQWIDTGFIPDDKTGLSIIAEQITYNDGYPMGIGKDAKGITAPRKLTNNSYSVSYSSFISLGSISSTRKYEASTNWLNNKKIITEIEERDLPTLSFSPGSSILIFRSGSDRVWKGRVYDAKISQGSDIVRHFIPAYDTVVLKPCMYDVVGRKAYYNKGTDEFTFNEILGIPHPLPAGFKKCAYLQSDGTQWIDTGVAPDSETGICIKGQNMQYGNCIPIGVAEGSYAIYPPRLRNNDIYYHYGTSATKMFSVDSAGDCVFTSSINLYNSKIVKFDSEDTDMELVLSSQIRTFTLPICFFSYNYNGSFAETASKWLGRIFRVKITQGDSLIHDYVPCLDANGRPCMYDIIEQEALYNQSGGTEFTYCVEHQLPSDFIKLRYLESTGTQYIKTNHVPTNETGLYMYAYSYGGDCYPMGMRDSSSNTLLYMGRVSSSSQDYFRWGTAINIGYFASRKFESTLNWLNDRQATITAPSLAKRVFSLGTLPFTPLYQLYLFGINNQDTSLVNPWNGQIYRAKISEGSEIIRDFVPAYDKRLDRPCMYDLINNVAYYNAGEDEFGYDKRFEGSFKGFGVLSGIGNKLGSDYNPINEKLPRDYTRIDFLENMEIGHINTGIQATGDLRITLETMAVSWNYTNYILGSFGNEADGEGEIVLSLNYNGGYGTAGSYRYGAEYLSFDYNYNQLNTRYKYVLDRNVVYRNGEVSKFLNNELLTKQTFTSKHPMILFAAWHYGPGLLPNGIKRLWSFNVVDTLTETVIINYIPAIDNEGYPCMFDTVTQQPFYNVERDKFVAGLKSMSHALQLRLPETGGAITLSVPINDNIEYYEEKIRNNNPNWTITFQYH